MNPVRGVSRPCPGRPRVGGEALGEEPLSLICRELGRAPTAFGFPVALTKRHDRKLALNHFPDTFGEGSCYQAAWPTLLPPPPPPPGELESLENTADSQFILLIHPLAGWLPARAWLRDERPRAAKLLGLEGMLVHDCHVKASGDKWAVIRFPRVAILLPHVLR